MWTIYHKNEFLLQMWQDGSIQLMGNVRKCHLLDYSMWKSRQYHALSKMEWYGFGQVMILQQQTFLLCCHHLDFKYMPRYFLLAIGNFCRTASCKLCKRSFPDIHDNGQIVIELPVEHGLLLDNLLDLAHAPFTHTSTFAKGWSVPRFVSLAIFV